MNPAHTLTRKILRSAAVTLAVASLAGVAAGARAVPAEAATSASYTWSGKCAYRWSNGWIKQGCLVRLGGRLYFRDAISPAWYLHLASGTWYVSLYPTGWMRGDDYYRAWGYYNTISASLYRQMCIRTFGKAC
ncbi:MAG: hypothetical protein WKF41_02460 [Gaiellaceae bacterium]